MYLIVSIHDVSIGYWVPIDMPRFPLISHFSETGDWILTNLSVVGGHAACAVDTRSSLGKNQSSSFRTSSMKAPQNPKKGHKFRAGPRGLLLGHPGVWRWEGWEAIFAFKDPHAQWRLCHWVPWICSRSTHFGSPGWTTAISLKMLKKYLHQRQNGELPNSARLGHEPYL